MNLSLRPLEDADLDVIYEQMKDPESVQMAAFTAADPADRRAFLAHMSRLRDDPSLFHRVIDVDGHVAGTIGCFKIDDRTEVTYWVDRRQWGRGIASAALQTFLAMTSQRPLLARAASDNAGSLRVLEKCGFRRIGVNRDFAPGRGEEIEETILRLDWLPGPMAGSRGEAQRRPTTPGTRGILSITCASHALARFTSPSGVSSALAVGNSLIVIATLRRRGG